MSYSVTDLNQLVFGGFAVLSQKGSDAGPGKIIGYTIQSFLLGQEPDDAQIERGLKFLRKAIKHIGE